MAPAKSFRNFRYDSFKLDSKTGQFEIFLRPERPSGDPKRNRFDLDKVLLISDKDAPGDKLGFFTSGVATDIHLVQSTMHYNICSEECEKDRTYDLFQVFQSNNGMRAWKNGSKIGTNVDLSFALNDVIGILDREILSGKSGFIDSQLAYDIHLDERRPWQMHYKAHLPGCHRTYELLEHFTADAYEYGWNEGDASDVRLSGVTMTVDATPAVSAKQVSKSSKATKSSAEPMSSSTDAEDPPEYQKDGDTKKPDVLKLENDLKDKDIELVNAKKELDDIKNEVGELRKAQQSQKSDVPTKDAEGEVAKLQAELKAVKADADVKELRYKLDLSELKNQLKDSEIQKLKRGVESAEDDGEDDGVDDEVDAFDDEDQEFMYAGPD